MEDHPASLLVSIHPRVTKALDAILTLRIFATIAVYDPLSWSVSGSWCGRHLVIRGTQQTIDCI